MVSLPSPCYIRISYRLLYNDFAAIEDVDTCRGVFYRTTQEVVVDTCRSGGRYEVDTGGIELTNGDEVPHGGRFLWLHITIGGVWHP